MIFFKRKKRRNTNRNYNKKLIGSTTPFAITEAFKMLRTNLLYVAKGEKCPAFGITSAYAHAGKSIIIANTAVSFAQLDKKVLIVDADMRCPVIHKLFKVKNEIGLSEIVAGMAGDNFEEHVIRSEEHGVDVITSGRIPPNPSELLSSVRMREFLASAREKYDYIFLDMPPICEVTDAGATADCITGYLFAVRSGTTDSREIDEALDTLKRMNANVVGMVLNDVNPKSGAYGKKKYGKYSKYGYYHSYESKSRQAMSEEGK
jgi:capsular exopolysaccharide synthesis family protein